MLIHIGHSGRGLPARRGEPPGGPQRRRMRRDALPITRSQLCRHFFNEVDDRVTAHQQRLKRNSDDADQACCQEGFDALDPFVASWSIEGSDDRMRRRLASDDAERRALLRGREPVPAGSAGLPRQPAIGRRIRTGSAAAAQLNALSLAHVAMAVEQPGSRTGRPMHAAAQPGCCRHHPIRQRIWIDRFA